MKNLYTVIITMDTPVNGIYNYNPGEFIPGVSYKGYICNSYTFTYNCESDLDYEEFKAEFFKDVKESYRNDDFMIFDDGIISAKHIVSVKVYNTVANTSDIYNRRSTGNPPNSTLL